jgi:hypothetical protein
MTTGSLACPTNGTQAAQKPRRARRPRLVVPGARLVDIAGGGLFLGLSRREMFRLVESGALKPVRIPGVRALRLDVRDLERLVEAGKAETTSPLEAATLDHRPIRRPA